jgi:hypothetical protein
MIIIMDLLNNVIKMYYHMMKDGETIEHDFFMYCKR